MTVLLLRLLAWLLVTVPLVSAVQAQQRLPNIVLILADDMGSDSVSRYNPQLGLSTPSIDALAAGETDLSAVLPAKRDPRLFRRDI